MTEASIGYGSEMHLDNGADVLTELDEVLTVTLPNPQVADVEATHMKSPNRRREYIAGLIEDGEGTFQFNYVAGGSTDTIIREAIDDGVERDYKIVLPVFDGSTWEVAGKCIVKGWERDPPIDDRQTATMTVRFTGASTEQAGA